MAAATRRFKVGAFNCLTVSYGTFVYLAAVVFANVGKGDYERMLRT
jgi:hypothetical protein